MDQSTFKSSDGVALSFEQQGSGPLIVALHGFPDTYRTWDHFGRSLVEDGYTFVTLAMRGYAPSGIPENGDYAIDRLAQDIVELLDHLDCQTAVIIGHDWGASAAYALAALYPERVSAMITLAIAPLAVAPSRFQESWSRPHNLYLGFGALSDWWLRRRNFREVQRLYRLWSPNWPIPRSHLDSVRGALRPKNRSRAAVDYYRLGKTAQSAAELAVQIFVPCLIIYGEDEPDVRKAAFRKALGVVGDGSELAAITGVGHWPHLEAPNRCLLEINRFLAKTSFADNETV